MEKILCVFLLFALCGTAFAVQAADGRLMGMGFTGASVPGYLNPYFSNPASLFFRDTSQIFTLEFSFNDSFPGSGRTSFPVNPSGAVAARFASRYISFTGLIDTVSTETGTGEGFRTYNAVRSLSADVCFTAGWRWMSLGLGLNAGTSRGRENFAVSDNQRVGDFFMNLVAGGFNDIPDSAFASLRAGAQLNLGNLTAGISAPSFFTYSDGTSFFSWQEFADCLEVGLSYSGSRYHGRARLNTVVFNGAFEIHRFLASEKTLHIGAELSIQAMSNLSFSFRAGYTMQPMDFADGTATAGLGLRLGKADIKFYADIPLAHREDSVYGLMAGIVF